MTGYTPPCTVAVLLALLLTPAMADEFKPTNQKEIVPAQSQLELLYDEGEFTEGPAPAADGAILFTDIGNRILRYDEATGKVTVFREPSGRANGLVFNPQGKLIACEGANSGGGRRISITEQDGKPRTLADSYDGKRFNSPNDLAIDAKGNVYFTDPRYAGDEPRELKFEGVFFVSPDGQVRLATRNVEKPNGILVSISGRQVYVADNNPRGKRQLAVFDIRSDGTLTNKKVLFDFGQGRGIDGMTLDRAGNIYATAGSGDAAGVYVFGPNGKNLALIPTPGSPTNCVFGVKEHGNTLYVTAQNPPPEDKSKPRRYGLYRIKLKSTGYHLWP